MLALKVSVQMKSLALTAAMAMLLALPVHADQVHCQARVAEANRTDAECKDTSIALKLRLRAFGNKHYGGNLSDDEWNFLKRNPPPEQKTEIETMVGEERRVADCQQRESLQRAAAKEACPTKGSVEQAVDAMMRQLPSGLAKLLSGPVTASEIEAVRSKLKPCWNTEGSSQSPIVQFRVEMNPDGTVAKASLVDAGRYASEPAYREAADKAYRAIMNPRCQPWPLPPEKYAAWKLVTMNFDARDY